MKKALVLISVAALLSACGQEASSPAPAPAAPAAAPAAPAPAPAAAAAPAPAPAAAPAAPAASAAAELPAECNAYLEKVTACLSKQSSGAADAMKASVDQTKAAWAAYGADQAQLAAACKASSDAFAAQAAAMKC